MVWVVQVVRVARTTSLDDMHSESRVGKLLIAHPMFPPQNPFAKTVIYIYQDDSVNGTVGVVLNRPSQTTVAQLAAQNGHSFFDTTKMVQMGGPVNKNSLIMLHTDDWHSSNTAFAGDKLRISSDTFILIVRLTRKNVFYFLF